VFDGNRVRERKIYPQRLKPDEFFSAGGIAKQAAEKVAVDAKCDHWG
jgi:hypothetical protein